MALTAVIVHRKHAVSFSFERSIVKCVPILVVAVNNNKNTNEIFNQIGYIALIRPSNLFEKNKKINIRSKLLYCLLRYSKTEFMRSILCSVLVIHRCAAQTENHTIAKLRASFSLYSLFSFIFIKYLEFFPL